MAHYDKNSPEYLGNGHYKIDGNEFMSIWAFKKKHNIQPNNAQANGSEGKELTSKSPEVHSSSPDMGTFAKVYLYKVADLEEYYGG